MESHNLRYDHWDSLEYEDDPDAQRKIRDEYKDAGILKLLEKLDHHTEKPDPDKQTQNAIILAFKRLIAIKLDFFDNDHADYLIDTIPGYIEENNRSINKLEKSFKSHRHATDKLYSEKPSW